MHILIGALVGGALFAVSYVVAQKLAGKPVTWQGVGGAVAGGVVTGALAATTFGASLVAEGGVTAVATVAVEGGAGSGTEQLVDNLLNKKPAMDNVVKQATIGAVTAPLFFGVFKGAATFLPEAETAVEHPIAANVSTVITDGSSIVKEVIAATTDALGPNGAADAAKAAQAIADGSAGASAAADAGTAAAASDAGTAAAATDASATAVASDAAAPAAADAAAPAAADATAPAAKTSSKIAAAARSALSHPALKDPVTHATSGAGLASSGVVLTVLQKVSSMLSSSPDSSTTASTPPAATSTAAAPGAQTSTAPGNVQISIPTNTQTPVSVTVNVGGPRPVINVGGKVGGEDNTQAREGITQAIGKLGQNP